MKGGPSRRLAIVNARNEVSALWLLYSTGLLSAPSPTPPSYHQRSINLPSARSIGQQPPSSSILLVTPPRSVNLPSGRSIAPTTDYGCHSGLGKWHRKYTTLVMRILVRARSLRGS
ncbi:hypothetical protein E8E15_004484 [Penicillium rubens]|uniref:Uncharacterized protein n=1 Tax=Penicillium chrysogenum TaxID=5076 RepID=A0A167XZ08_PENCH|nr:uncharacterized protein N7525_010433 [Penicillium rubens]KAF3021218.1 hypothetical protein E8E15_004484 [Penicillium rubens]KAJ5821149.1 hypothetical protein N7525_010433 [Penicillium rubens]KAJ5858799.1 hypothetical protein N7534_004076 [Penicillium rubens]KZN93376.1 hypothetical protein EN45_035500 [Penicillium chrysogenum]